MTIRKQVSFIYNRWYDGEQVDQTDMTVEQTRNVSTDASIIQNHFGSGILPSGSSQTILMDTDNLFAYQSAMIAANTFDGTGLAPLTQPSDSTLGNQLEIQLTDSSSTNGMSTALGRLSTKVLIIGLDFQGNPQYDTFYFYRKEIQVTKKHYTKILAVFFNDFLGNNHCSRPLGGRVVIRETASFQLSRDPIMISQDTQPNLFFRDFKIPKASSSSALTLAQALQQGIGSEYSVDSLNINTTVLRELELSAGDVVTKYAEKFTTTSTNNNIQKISILLGARIDKSANLENQFDWSGDLVVSVYALQTSVSSPTDLVPALAIEYDPNPIPLVQFSFNQKSLKDQGYILTDVLQPVDLIFSNSVIGNTINSVIVPGKIYCVSIGRSGDSSVGTIFTGVGNSTNTDSRLSIFTGEWTDVPGQDLWFQVWSDAAKVSDGQAYDSGNGMEISKTTTNDLGVVVDYCFGQNPLVNNGQGTLNTAIIEAIATPSVQQQDERTGNPVYVRQQFEPSMSFVTDATLATLRASSEPLVIGCALDANAKGNSIITGVQHFPGLVKGNVFSIINPDVSIISQQLIGSKLIPNNTCDGLDYKIVRVKICTDGYGDVNGDGSIDTDDIFRATKLLNNSLELASTQQLIAEGSIDTLEILRADVDGDGYVTSNDVTLITNYVNRTIKTFPVGSSFQHAEITVENSTGRMDGYYDCDGYIRLDGYIGENIIDPSSLSAIELQYYGFNNTPSMDGDDSVFNTVPFSTVNYVIRPIPFWQDYMLQFSSEARLVPAVFSYTENANQYVDSKTGACGNTTVTTCSDSSDFTGVCSPGRNDFFIPNNLIIGNGQIINKDGSFFKQDLEIQTITIEIPQQILFQHAVMNIFSTLVLDSGNGFTSSGYPALKFSDCSTVQSDAFAKNQIRFGVAVQSIYPSIDGYDVDGYGIIVDNVIGVNIDQSTGIMTLSAMDIAYSSVYSELRTKIQITVYLKKAGWNNSPVTISANQFAGLFVSGVST